MSTSGTTPSGSSTLATSQEIRDRGSTFVACMYRAGSVAEAKECVRRRHRRRGQAEKDGHVRADADRGRETGAETHMRAGTDTDKRDVDGESYAIAAWRVMVVKPGCTGLGGSDDFEVGEGCEDGGERWAGGKVLGVMQREGVMDAVVVVHRWFGGTLLGPIRFTHIETCAGQVCRRFKKMEEMEGCVETLRDLDTRLESSRADLAHARDTTSSGLSSGKKRKAPDYRAMQDALDFTKVKRLIRARECEIKNTKELFIKYSKERSD